MKVELRDEYSTPNPDEIAAMAARGDYMDDSLVDTTYDEAMEGAKDDLEAFLKDKAFRGHFGVFEHAQGSFFVEGLSRSAMAQVTRHRHMSFDVQSQRYVNFEDKEPVIPPTFEDTSATIDVPGQESSYMEFATAMEHHWQHCLSMYTQAISAGIPKEDARFFLPLATPVNMTMSANPRTLMHFLDLRDNMKAQWEAQNFAQEISKVSKEWAPLTFEAYEDKLNNNSLRAP